MRLWMPWQNLGCLGLRVGRRYADIFRSRTGRWGLHFTLFYTNGRNRRGYVRLT